MNTALAFYFGFGTLLIGISVIRGWKFWRPREVGDVCMVVGYVMLWPIALGIELHTVWLNRRRASPRRGEGT